MCVSMVEIQYATAEIRRGKKKNKKKPRGKNIMYASATQGSHNNKKRTNTWQVNYFPCLLPVLFSPIILGFVNKKGIWPQKNPAPIMSRFSAEDAAQPGLQ